MSLTTAYTLLFVAIAAEVAGTMMLKSSENFTRLWPSLVVIVGYGLSFYLLSYALKVIPVGVSYAIWSGVGIVLVSLLSWLCLKQRLDLPALAGMGLIMAGVIVINLFSKSIPRG